MATSKTKRAESAAQDVTEKEGDALADVALSVGDEAPASDAKPAVVVEVLPPSPASMSVGFVNAQGSDEDVHVGTGFAPRHVRLLDEGGNVREWVQGMGDSLVRASARGFFISKSAAAQKLFFVAYA